MGAVGKSFSLLLAIVLAVSSLLMAESALAQSIPKPSIPEFTLKYSDYSYDFPPTLGIDPYTGKTIITNSGGHVENKTIDVKINNQPFTSELSNGSVVSLYYTVRFKGHYGNESDWIYPISGIQNWIKQTNDEYTVFTVRTNPANQIYLPSYGEVDFQVNAHLGNVNLINGRFWGANDYYVFDGTDSGWSNTQTITIPETVNTSPYPSPTVPEFSSAIVLVTMLIVLLLAISVFKRKK